MMGNPLSLIVSNARIIKIVGIIALIVAYCFLFMAYKLEKKNHELTIEKYQSAAAEAKAKAELFEKQSEKIKSNIIESYSQSEKEIHEYYAKNPTIKYRTLRVAGVQPETCSSADSEKSESSSRTPSRTERAEEAPSSEIRLDMQQVSIEVTRCIALIDFIKKQEALENLTE